jgi:hypothetical protein
MIDQCQNGSLTFWTFLFRERSNRHTKRRRNCAIFVNFRQGRPDRYRVVVPGSIAGDRMPRTCTICRHPERHAIEADLRAGIPYRDIARRHNISKHALSRHRLNHLSRHTATALATTIKIKPLLDKAETAPTWNGTLLAIREARRCLEELVMLLNSTVPSLPE